MIHCNWTILQQLTSNVKVCHCTTVTENCKKDAPKFTVSLLIVLKIVSIRGFELT